MSPRGKGSAVSEGKRKCGLREEKEVRSPRGKGSAVSERKRKCGLPGGQKREVWTEKKGKPRGELV
jgi:hypothetical protein